MKPVYVIVWLMTAALWCPTAWAEPVSESGLADQVGVEVTAYNSNLALIKDLRTVDLAQGVGELRFMDVAAHIMPTTVSARSLNQPGQFAVLEQNYEYDLMNDQRLLDKYVGRTLKIVDWNEPHDRKETVSAELLSNNDGQIYRIDGEIYLGHPGVKVLPKLPEDLIAKPTLTWLYENGAASAHRIEVTYLTRNISWQADYVLVLDAEDTSGDLSGWVTLDNQSGAAYPDARLKLVAGEVNQVEPEMALRMAVQEAAPPAGSPQFKEASFFEYHIYDMQRRTTLKDRQTKQIRLLEAAGIGVEKELLVHGVKAWFMHPYNGQPPRLPVQVYVSVANTQANRLGMPLPAGIMRLYKADADGSLQFVGEDRILHTPRDETVRLRIGEAFDVVAERVQTDYRRLSTQLHETEWEITLKNHKPEAVTVGIVEPLFGNWQVVSSSGDYRKMDAFTIRFDADRARRRGGQGHLPGAGGAVRPRRGPGRRSRPLPSSQGAEHEKRPFCPTAGTVR